MKTCPVIQTVRVCLLGVLLASVSGCVTSPISKELRKQAKPLTLTQVAANPSTYTGTVVIWGGQVVNTVNSTNGGSIYVLELPLNDVDRPQSPGVSPGRFIARSRGFIDPEVFKAGRLITVAGTIAGVETEPLQKMQYTYPVVAIDELHLWHRVYYTYPGWGWYGPGWNWGWYGPGWGWGWYGPGWGWYGPGWGWGWGWD